MHCLKQKEDVMFKKFMEVSVLLNELTLRSPNLFA